jgi:hypothetical protein
VEKVLNIAVAEWSGGLTLAQFSETSVHIVDRWP